MINNINTSTSCISFPHTVSENSNIHTDGSMQGFVMETYIQGSNHVMFTADKNIPLIAKANNSRIQRCSITSCDPPKKYTDAAANSHNSTIREV